MNQNDPMLGPLSEEARLDEDDLDLLTFTEAIIRIDSELKELRATEATDGINRRMALLQAARARFQKRA